MKNISHMIDMQASMTEVLPQSPEEELKYISSNVSFEGSPHKAIILRGNYHPFIKKESFLINGWENPHDRHAKSLQRESKAKRTQFKHPVTSNISKLLNPQPKRTNMHSLELKASKDRQKLNFKCGYRSRLVTSSTKSSENASIMIGCSQAKFNEHLSKQKKDMMSFYNNERIKRRLMIDPMEPHQSISIVEYPLYTASARNSQTNQRKRPIYRKLFH